MSSRRGLTSLSYYKRWENRSQAYRGVTSNETNVYLQDQRTPAPFYDWYGARDMSSLATSWL